MANKRIRELTTQGTYSDAYYVAVEDASGFVEAKKMTLQVLTGTEAAARAAQDNVIEAGCGLNANGTYTAPANSWYSRNAEFTAGCTDRGGATGALTANIYNSIRLLDAKIYTIDIWAKGSGTESAILINTINPNVASGNYAVSIGAANLASGDYSFCVGSGNVVNADYGICVGTNLVASAVKASAFGFYTTASGIASHSEGYQVTASGNYSHAGGDAVSNTNRVIAAGISAFNHSHNTNGYAGQGAAANYSAILGGVDNSVEALSNSAIIVGGTDNTIKTQALYSGIIGGRENIANNVYTGILGGRNAQTFLLSSRALSSGQVIAKNGDAQSIEVVAYTFSTNATPQNFLIGDSDRITIPEDCSMFFEIKIVASETGGVSGTVGQSFTQRINGCIKNVGGTTAIEGSTNAETAIKHASFGGTVAVSADDTNDALQIRVTGEADKDIAWVAYVNLVMVGYRNFDLG